MVTDLELLDRWQAGNKQAGNALFQRYFDSISRFFENKIDRDVDELIQSTFYALVRHRDRFRKQCSFRTYLFTIARNELYGYLRKRQRDGARLDFAVTSLMDLGTTPTARLVRGQQQALLLTALRSLPLEQQLIIELHYWEGIGFDELAAVFEVVPTTTRTRLHRARKALRARMQALSDEAAAPLADNEPDLDAWARSLREHWTDESVAEPVEEPVAESVAEPVAEPVADPDPR